MAIEKIIIELTAEQATIARKLSMLAKRNKKDSPADFVKQAINSLLISRFEPLVTAMEAVETARYNSAVEMGGKFEEPLEAYVKRIVQSSKDALDTIKKLRK